MIVTRQRQVKKSYRGLILPLVAIVALAVAWVWPPSHHAIVDGPLAPAWKAANVGANVAFAPLHFAAQQQAIADKNREIQLRDAKLEDQRKVMLSRDQKIAALQSQVKAIQQAALDNTAAAKTPVQGVRGGTPVGAQNASASKGDAAFGATTITPSDDPKRIAQIWSAMDPEKAAAVARRLPEAYTARVFGNMGSDSVGEILGSLPADYAARVSQLIRR